MIVIIMGVSGSGKTTVGSLLADKLGWAFFDADDFHSEANRQKMGHGIPLTDSDRASWLAVLRELIREKLAAGTPIILACSALKESHRAALKVNDEVIFVHLKGEYAEIKFRLKSRKGHYMPVELLASQFESLEEPDNALVVDIKQTVKEIVENICKGLAL